MANILSQIGSAVASKVSTLQGNIDAEATSRANADSAASGRLDTLEADPTTQALLDAESTSRANADSAASGRLDTLEADPTTQALLDAESTSRSNADSAASGRLDTLEADPTTQTLLDAETSTRGSEDSALSGRIDTLEADPTTATDVALKYDKTGGTISGDMTVTGDFTVQGTTAAVETTNLEVTDALIVSAKGGNGSADSGIIVDCGGTNKFMGWNAATSKFEFMETDAVSGSSDVDGGTHSYSDIKVADVYIGDNVLGEYSDFSSALG